MDHAKAPWMWDVSEATIWDADANPVLMIWVPEDFTVKEFDAVDRNASLAAASPRLLDVLKALTKAVENDHAFLPGQNHQASALAEAQTLLAEIEGGVA